MLENYEIFGDTMHAGKIEGKHKFLGYSLPRR